MLKLLDATAVLCKKDSRNNDCLPFHSAFPRSHNCPLKDLQKHVYTQWKGEGRFSEIPR